MRFRPRFGSALKRLVPGARVERWLLLLFLGVTIVSLGVAYVLVDVHRTWGFPSVFYYLTLQFFPHVWRGLLFGVARVSAIIIAVVRPNRSLLSAFRAPGQSSLGDTTYSHGLRVRRPTVVAMGVGTGLSALLERRGSIHIASPLSSPWRTTALVPAVCNVLWDYCQMEQSHSRKRHSISRPVRLWRLLCCRKTSGRPRFFLWGRSSTLSNEGGQD